MHNWYPVNCAWVAVSETLSHPALAFATHRRAWINRVRVVCAYPPSRRP